MSQKLKTDVVIIGSGPAGLQAAIHVARRSCSVTVLGRIETSQLSLYTLSNYCCMDSAVSGVELLRHGRQQAASFGAKFLERDVMRVESADGRFRLMLESGNELEARTIILASGVSRNRLGVPGEKEYVGKGVSYCVDCDAVFFKGCPVAMVGDGSSAASGSVLLAAYASKVYLVSRGLHVSEPLLAQVRACAVERLEGENVKAIEGDNSRVRRLVLSSGRVLEVEGVFVELGAKGAVDLFVSLGIKLDDETGKYVAVNQWQETNVPGVLAAGDVCGPPFQVAKSIGQGCVAGIRAAEYVCSLG